MKKIKIKICGITETILPYLLQWKSVLSQMDYLGLNFYPHSKRYVNLETAKKIFSQIKHINLESEIVGIFVNMDPTDLLRCVQYIPLDVIQLHGDEDPNYIYGLRSKLKLKIWKAIQVQSLTQVESSIDIYQDIVDGILLDASNRVAYGGGGKSFDWGMLHVCQKLSIPWMVAGGINANNIFKLLSCCSPDVIDICSGVEQDGNPRKKDEKKINNLFNLVYKYSHQKKRHENFLPSY